MIRDVILSLHPKFAKSIYEDRKHWEFRTVPPPVGEMVYIYETDPVCQVTGAMAFSYAVSGEPTYVWNVVKSLGHFHGAGYNKPGISREAFYAYAKGKKSITALRILAANRWDHSMPLPIGFRPPQNWAYWRHR